MKRLFITTIITVALSVSLFGAMSAPANLGIIYDNTKSSVKVSWDALSETFNASYTVNRSSIQGGPFTLTRSAISNTVTAYYEVLSNTLTPYVYSVHGVELSGISGTAQTVNVSPYPPMNLMVKRAPYYATVKWDKHYSPGVTSYNVYRDDGGGYASLAYVVGTSFSDNSVLAQQYWYKLRSVSGTAQGAWSVTKSAKPFGVTTTAYNSKVLIEWDNSADTSATTYNIYRSTSGNFSAPIQVFDKFYLDESVSNGFYYNYEVEVINGISGDVVSRSVSITAYPYAVPSTVSDFSHTTITGQMDIFWSDEGAGTYQTKEYLIYRGTYFGSTVDSYTVVIPKYSDTAVSANTRYYYQVITADTEGNTSQAAYYDAYYGGTPSAPQGLTYTSMLSNSISLDWVNNASDENVTGYALYRNGALLVSRTASNYTDFSLAHGEIYDYMVVAQNVTGVSASSNTLTVKIEARAPTGVTVTPNPLVEGELYLDWNDNTISENISWYTVYRALDPGSFGGVYDYITSASKITDTAVALGTEYFYKIYAHQNGRDGRPSITVSAKPMLRPIKPTGLTATADVGYVHLTWTALGPDYDISKYTIYRSLDDSLYNSIGASATWEYFDTNITLDTMYYYKISATNYYGMSSTSDVIYATPTASTIGSPQNLTATSNHDKTISLSWDSVLSQNATFYNIYRSITTTAYTETAIAHSVSVTVFTDTPPATLTDFYYIVTAQDITSGAVSNEVLIQSDQRPGPPLNVKIDNIFDLALLSWEPNTDLYDNTNTVNAYNIYRSDASDPSDFVKIKNYHIGNYYLDSDVNTGNTYYYRIKTLDINGEENLSLSSYSINLSGFTTPPGTIAAIEGNGQVTIFWNNISPVRYNLYRKQGTGLYVFLTALTFDKTRYFDTGLTNDVEYTYAIAAINEAGEGPKSAGITVIPYFPATISNKTIAYTLVNKKEVSLDWDVATKGSYTIDGYAIFRSNDGGGSYQILSRTAAIETAYYDDTTEWDNTYYYMVRVVDDKGNSDAAYNILVIDLPLPKNKIRVFSNLINLNDGETLKLRYYVAQSGKIKLKIHTLSGIHVKTLADTEIPEAITADNPLESADIIWDGTNEAGKKVASGAYLIIMELDGDRVINKVAVVK